MKSPDYIVWFSVVVGSTLPACVVHCLSYLTTLLIVLLNVSYSLYEH